MKTLLALGQDPALASNASKRYATHILIPIWVKIAVTLFICVLIPVNWRQYGPANFLWFSDIALFLTGVSLWWENRLLASMAALAVLLPELAWNLDFFFRLLTGKPGIGLSNYMFDSSIPLAIRSVSLFHVWLPILLIWMLHRIGYDHRAWYWQTLLAVVVLPLSYLCGGSKMNVNWVYGWGEKSQTIVPSQVFLLFVMLAFPILVYAPTQLLLRKFFVGPPPG